MFFTSIGYFQGGRCCFVGTAKRGNSVVITQPAICKTLDDLIKYEVFILSDADVNVLNEKWSIFFGLVEIIDISVASTCFTANHIHSFDMEAKSMIRLKTDIYNIIAVDLTFVTFLVQ